MQVVKLLENDKTLCWEYCWRLWEYVGWCVGVFKRVQDWKSAKLEDCENG